MTDLLGRPLLWQHLHLRCVCSYAGAAQGRTAQLGQTLPAAV